MAVMPAVPLHTVALRDSGDPYLLTPHAIEAPPTSVAASLRRVGPGMVLAAAIVGSGELIATTTLGAQVGFAALWIILVSCVIKPVVQAELGRYTIATGHTGLEGFDRVPGPRLGVSWLVWAWGITVALTLLQVGGMYGGVAQVLHLLAPAIPLNLWVGICLLLTIGILLGGGYERIEKLAIVKVGFFTMLTICAAAVLLRSDAITTSALAGGLSLRLPAAGPRHRDCRVRDDRCRRDRAGAVPILVRRKRLCAIRRAARWIGGLDLARPRLDPRHASRHRVLPRDLYVGDGRLLPARRRCAAPDGCRAGGA
jgi:hypothetical protein